jgi:hypothetical protein
MFMRFRGGGVGHIETRHLDLKLKGDSHKSGDEQQDEATIAGIQRLHDGVRRIVNIILDLTMISPDHNE